MIISVNVTEEQRQQLEKLSKAFNLSKSTILRNLAFNNMKNVKTKDYNLVFNELLQLNKNVSELLNFLKKQNAEDNAEAIFLLYEMKDKIEKIEKKI